MDVGVFGREADPVLVAVHCRRCGRVGSDQQQARPAESAQALHAGGLLGPSDDDDIRRWVGLGLGYGLQ
jgi:hypothetical protein